MDDKFTAKVQQWLDTPVSERDIEAGATLLLQLNRNRILHASIMRKPQRMHAKLEYELRKNLKIRLDGFTLREVVAMERTVIPSTENSLAAGIPQEPESPEEGVHYIGKREDHATLPEDIQAIYVRNGEVYSKLKETYETLKQMENAPACDRYEHLKVLKELDEEYRANWKRYDHFDINAPSPETEPATTTPKEISAARKYLSSNKGKLAAAIEAGNEDKIAKLRGGMQERVTLIIAAGEGFDEEYRQSLEVLGLVFS